MQFLFMRSSVLCIVTYGAIKIYAVQIMQPVLDLHNSHKQNITQKFIVIQYQA